MMGDLRGAVALGLAAITLSLPGPAFAQDVAGGDRLLGRFLDLATAELDLDREQRTGLERLLRETMDRRRELRAEQARLRREIGTALSNPDTEDAEFARLADRLATIRSNELELFRWQRAQLGEILEPRKTLRFLLIQERLARRIERERMRRDPGR